MCSAEARRVDPRPAPSAEALQPFRQADWAIAWLPDEVELPDAWAVAGFQALGRMQMSGGPRGRTTWDQLVDDAGERIVSIPVGGGRGLTTITSPLRDGVAAVTTVGGPARPWKLMMWADHPSTGLFHGRGEGAGPDDWLRSHGRLLARAGPVEAVHGRNEWRRAQRRIQARTLDWAAAGSHAIRHKFAVVLATVVPLLLAYFGSGLLRDQDGLAPGALPASAAGLGAPLALLLISGAAVLSQRAYVRFATQRLAASGPIPEVEPPA